MRPMVPFQTSCLLVHPWAVLLRYTYRKPLGMDTGTTLELPTTGKKGAYFR
jgi:hypothetical protein